MGGWVGEEGSHRLSIYLTGLAFWERLDALLFPSSSSSSSLTLFEVRSPPTHPFNPPTRPPTQPPTHPPNRPPPSSGPSQSSPPRTPHHSPPTSSSVPLLSSSRHPKLQKTCWFSSSRPSSTSRNKNLVASPPPPPPLPFSPPFNLLSRAPRLSCPLGESPPSPLYRKK